MLGELASCGIRICGKTDVGERLRFGLGRVYQKMGKTRFAEYHFRRALEINPSNVVLYCCVGTVSACFAFPIILRTDILCLTSDC
jgi:hypothetical protein